MTIKNKLLVAAGLAGSVALGHQAASANDTQQHTIKSGETLSAIANMYNTSVDEIAKNNNISNVDQIYTGENLIIGQASSSESTDSTLTQTTTSAANGDGSYTVQLGDNLWTLASRFNTTVSNLASWNNIQNADQLSVGQVLKTSVSEQMTPAATTTDTQIHTNSQAEAQTTSESTTATTTDTAATTQDKSSATVVNTSATVSNQSTTADSTDEQSALQTIIMLESGGNVNATNGIYYGIGQMSPSLRARYGGNTADYQDQLQAMKSYIADRYGSAVAALAHHHQYNWY